MSIEKKVISPEAGKNQVIFSIEKLYVRDLSLEVPNAPQIFLEKEQPKISVDLNNEFSKIEDGIYQNIIGVNVTAKLDEKVVFIIEVSYAGIFQIRNLPDEYLESALNVDCPNIVFPFLRETVTSLIVKAGFPPVFLSPVNFQAVYESRKANKSS